MFPHIFFDPLKMPPLDSLTIKLRDEVASLGYELVDARLAGPPRRRSIRLRIDRPDSRPGAGVTSEDCTRVTREVLRWLAEVAPDEVVDALEVSSPGLERPVRWPEHWRRYLGQRVRVRARGVSGRPVGVIREVPDDEHVVLEFEGQREPQQLALADITEATLVVDWSTIR